MEFIYGTNQVHNLQTAREANMRTKKYDDIVQELADFMTSEGKNVTIIKSAPRWSFLLNIFCVTYIAISFLLSFLR